MIIFSFSIDCVIKMIVIIYEPCEKIEKEK